MATTGSEAISWSGSKGHPSSSTTLMYPFGRGSAGRTRTYNQWINSHAQTVRVAWRGVDWCRSVYLFAPYVWAEAVPCGLVWLHIWLHPKCGALPLSSAILPNLRASTPDARAVVTK